jgi:hypothetical protein
MAFAAMSESGPLKVDALLAMSAASCSSACMLR